MSPTFSLHEGCQKKNVGMLGCPAHAEEPDGNKHRDEGTTEDQQCQEDVVMTMEENKLKIMLFQRFVVKSILSLNSISRIVRRSEHSESLAKTLQNIVQLINVKFALRGWRRPMTHSEHYRGCIIEGVTGQWQ